MNTRFIFFSGKGGVGKTSMACVHAIHYADKGQRTLIVTTDPASNLADVFEQKIGHQITPIQGVPNLWAMEIDPDRATEEYKDRALAPVRAAFPAEMVRVIEEQMSGPCTAEVAAFDRFTDFLDISQQESQSFEIVIFDTAPTGHTLRLLELPFAWSNSIEVAAEGGGQTCIGPAAAIQDAKEKYERAMAIMRNPAQTIFTFVLHPEAIAIKETQRAIAELGKLGIHAHHLIINGIIPATEKSNNSLFAARAEMQGRYLQQIDALLPLPAQRMSLLDGEIKGVARLRQVARILFEAKGDKVSFASSRLEVVPMPLPSPQADVLPRILPNSHSRTLFFAGKGGVGKTVASCMTAVWLAQHGYRVLLITTDPAAHLGDVLDVPVGEEIAPVAGIANLWATKIDPKAAAEAYKARILDDARQRGRPPEAIQVMAEELDSPCTEEMAAFDRFIDLASREDNWQVIIFDTAPTGHTLRLLELPVDWSKQLEIRVFASVDSSAADNVTKQRFGQVIAMMRDPQRSTFAFVMYPEATPILEAHRAIEELRTVGVEPGLVIANMVIPPEQCTTDFAEARRFMQARYLNEMVKRFPVPIVHIPLLPYEVRGLRVLKTLGEQVYGQEISVPTR
jgi:arsenite-transporting ATPase